MASTNTSGTYLHICPYMRFTPDPSGPVSRCLPDPSDPASSPDLSNLAPHLNPIWRDWFPNTLVETGPDSSHLLVSSSQVGISSNLLLTIKLAIDDPASFVETAANSLDHSPIGRESFPRSSGSTDLINSKDSVDRKSKDSVDRAR